ncbi:MAG: DUF2835 family protein [Gammaproteobacteria bacterium]|nr:DUF2835 family protein [Gammaproteobacteria bacterium]
MTAYEFSLALSASETERIYRGDGRYILVETDAGLSLRLPAGNFRPFVDCNGIQGRFRVRIDDSNRLQKLERV